jgi:hypothetical protein
MRASAYYTYSPACRNLINSEDRRVNINYVWKSISHEIGHTVGLAHKGVLLANSSRQEYYTIPPAPGLWAPVSVLQVAAAAAAEYGLTELKLADLHACLLVGLDAGVPVSCQAGALQS